MENFQAASIIPRVRTKVAPIIDMIGVKTSKVIPANSKLEAIFPLLRIEVVKTTETKREPSWNTAEIILSNDCLKGRKYTIKRREIKMSSDGRPEK